MRKSDYIVSISTATGSVYRRCWLDEYGRHVVKFGGKLVLVKSLEEGHIVKFACVPCAAR